MIHFDHNATSPLRPCAREALLSWLAVEGSGNPSSLHAAGRRARARVEDAREAVAALLGTRPDRITFTSGATEADNAAVEAWAQNPSRPLLAASRLEHPAVQEPLRRHEDAGAVLWLPATSDGTLDLSCLDALPASHMGLLCCMGANNETGRLLPWREAGEWGAAHGVPVHADLTQLAGKAPLSLDETSISSAALSGHKLGALTGTGVLWTRAPLPPLLRGGSQERGRRAGTENLAGIITLGAVAAWLREHGEEERARIATLGARLRERVAEIPGVSLSVPAEGTLPGTVHLRLPVDAEAVLIRLDRAGIAVSSGSACSAGALEPSATLLAMGWNAADEAHRALRLSLGWNSTEAEVDIVSQTLAGVVTSLTAIFGAR